MLCSRSQYEHECSDAHKRMLSWSLLLSTIVVLMLHLHHFVPFVVPVLPGIFNGFSPHATQFGCHFRGSPVNRKYMASCSSPRAANHVCLHHGGEVYDLVVPPSSAATLLIYSTACSPFFMCGFDYGRCLLWQILP